MPPLSGYIFATGETSVCRVDGTDYTDFTDNGDGTCTVSGGAQQDAAPAGQAPIAVSAGSVGTASPAGSATTGTGSAEPPVHNGPLTLTTDEHAQAKSLLSRIATAVEGDAKAFVHELAALLRHVV